MTWQRRYERKAVRRYAHMTPWRPCYALLRGPCLRCRWRQITGQNRRAKAAHIARVRELRLTLPRKVYRQDADGRWRYVETLPPTEPR